MITSVWPYMGDEVRASQLAQMGDEMIDHSPWLLCYIAQSTQPPCIQQS